MAAAAVAATNRNHPGHRRVMPRVCPKPRPAHIRVAAAGVCCRGVVRRETAMAKPKHWHWALMLGVLVAAMLIAQRAGAWLS